MQASMKRTKNIYFNKRKTRKWEVWAIVKNRSFMIELRPEGRPKLRKMK